jgi:hypothetical protein
MITIHLINGDIVELPSATNQSTSNSGNTTYYDKDKVWVGTLTRNGSFIDPHNAKHPNRYIRNKGNTLEDMISRIGNRDNFTWQENEAMMKLKKLLTFVYLPKSGKYKL